MENPASAPVIGYEGPAAPEVQQYWLDVAWRSLQQEDRGIVARVLAGELDAATVADVVTAAARRVLRNPDGRQSAANAIDDFREEWKVADATEDVYFTAAELRRLQPAAAGSWAGSMKYC